MVSNPRHILVSMLLPIGDTLLATPALAALHRRFPRASITVLVSASNASVLEGNPDVTRTIVIVPGSGSPSGYRFTDIVRQISREKDDYDLVINFSAVGRIVTFLAGVRQPRLTLHMPPAWWLVGNYMESFRARHAVDHYLLAVSPLLDREITPEQRVPRLYLNSIDRDAARRILRQSGVDRTGPVVTMHVGASGFNGRKQWAPERFAEVANMLIETFGAYVVLIGGKDDIELADATAALIPTRVAQLAGETRLRHTAAIIETSTLFIGNDSGPLHIAAALGTQSIGIFGPSNWEQFQPVARPGTPLQVIHSDLPCSPCFNFIGNSSVMVPNLCYTRACLKAITPEQVAAVAIDMLSERDDAAGPLAPSSEERELAGTSLSTHQGR